MVVAAGGAPASTPGLSHLQHLHGSALVAFGAASLRGTSGSGLLHEATLAPAPSGPGACSHGVSRDTALAALGSAFILATLGLSSWAVARRSSATPEVRADAGAQRPVEDEGRRKHGGGAKVRDAVFDNARYALLIVVMYMHMFRWGRSAFFGQLWMENDDGGFYYRFFRPLRCIAIPGFAWLSGYFSREPPNARRWRRLVESILLAWLVYCLFLGPVLDAISCWRLPKDSVQETGLRLLGYKGHRPRVEWLLKALFIWRGSAYCIHMICNQAGLTPHRWVAAVAVVLAMAFPYLPSRAVWPMQGMVFHVPAFVLGMLLPMERFLEAVPSSWPWKLLGLAVLGLWVWLMGSWQDPPVPGTELAEFFLNMPFRTAGEVPEDACPLEQALFPSRALFAVLAPMLVFVISLALLCPRRELWCTRLGGEGSMYLLLLHPFFVNGFYTLTGSLPPIPVETAARQACLWMIQLSFIIAVSCVVGMPSVIRVFKPLIHPTWIGDAVLGPQEQQERKSESERTHSEKDKTREEAERLDHVTRQQAA